MMLMMYCCLVATSLPAAHGMALSIEGRVLETQFEQGGSKSHPGRFALITDSENWHIRYERDGDTVAYWESGRDLDSELVFTVGRLDFGAMAEVVAQSKGLPDSVRLAQNPEFQAIGFVEVGPVPRASGTTPAISVLFYAFCSSTWMDEHNSDLSKLQIPFTVDGQVAHYELGLESVRVASLTRYQGSPGLPESAIFVHQGKHWTINGPKQLPAPFGSGFTNALLVAEGWTNVGGSSLPTRVRFDLYLPDFARSEVVKRQSIVIDVSSIASSARTVAFRPSISETTRISDRRHMTPSDPFMQVAYTSNHWLVADDELKSLPSFVEALARQQEAKLLGQPAHVGVSGIGASPPPKRSWRQVVILVMMGVLLAFPAVLYVLHRKRSA